jgi:plasmid stabilization system protein ParE
VIRLGDAAERQLDELLDHYSRPNRSSASQSLIAAIDEAMEQIERDPTAGLPAPRPYPHLA